VIENLMPTRSIALIGDYDPDVTAHRAIPLATQFQRERAALNGRNHPLLAAFVPAVRTNSADHFAPRLKNAKRERELRTYSAKDEMAAKD
jgi:hypothetical protein